jgi:hypothetical protein
MNGTFTCKWLGASCPTGTNSGTSVARKPSAPRFVKRMSNEASITVNQEGVKSFAAALWSPQQYEIFIDDQKIGVLNGYTNHKTQAISSGTHSVYVRAYARNSVSFARVYGYSQTLEVNVSPGEDKTFSCGLIKGPPARKPLILIAALITLLLFLGLGPIGDLPQRTRYAAAMVMALVTMACSWYGYSSAPGTTIYLKEAWMSPDRSSTEGTVKPNLSD